MSQCVSRDPATGIYKNFKNYTIPDIDLLTLIFDSKYSLSKEDQILHIDASNPLNRLTKADLRRYLEQFAHGLHMYYGIGASGPYKDIVVVMTTGQILASAAFFGIMAAGGVYSAANPAFTASELARQLKQGNAKALIVSADLKDVGVKAAKLCGLNLKSVLLLQSNPEMSLKSLDGGVDCNSAKRLTWRRVTDPVELKRSLILLLYSSGTTGLPKGVKLSHRNLVAQIWGPRVQLEDWTKKNGQNAAPIQMRTLAHLPVAHVAGVLNYQIQPLWSGTQVYWMRKYEWQLFLEYNKIYGITQLLSVPSIFLRIAKSPEVKDQFKALEVAVSGAAPMDGQLQKAANVKLGAGKIYIGQTWGLSETTGPVTAMPKWEYDDTGSLSPILPNIEVRCVGENGIDVEPGQPGELWVRGPIVTEGYYNNLTATMESFVGDWFCTGDVAIDRTGNGKFYIVDRNKELFKYRGEQIAPAELEAILLSHPNIQEAAVVGVPQRGGSEVPRAYIQADPKQICEEEVKAFVAARVASYKQLRGGVVFMDELPKNAVGKVLRRKLRDLAREEIQSVPKL